MRVGASAVAALAVLALSPGRGRAGEPPKAKGAVDRRAPAVDAVGPASKPSNPKKALTI